MNTQVEEKMKTIAFLMMLAKLQEQKENEVVETEVYKPTLGERRMRITYNSEDESEVYKVKEGAANLIDYLEAKKNDFASKFYDMDEQSFKAISADFFREVSLAQTEVEKSTYFVVKALTNPEL